MRCPNCDNDPGIGMPAGVGLKSALRGRFKCGQCDTVLRRVVSERAKITMGAGIVLYLFEILSYRFLPEFHKSLMEEPVYILVFSGLLFLLLSAAVVFFIKDLSCKAMER